MDYGFDTYLTFFNTKREKNVRYIMWLSQGESLVFDMYHHLY